MAFLVVFGSFLLVIAVGVLLVFVDDLVVPWVQRRLVVWLLVRRLRRAWRGHGE